MKQRILALLLFLALLLSGCGAGESSSPPEPSPTPAPAHAAAPTPLPNSLPAPVPTPEPGLSTAGADPDERFPFDYREELADTEDFSLSVTAMGLDAEDNWVIHLRLENRASEIMNFRFFYQSINGLAIDDELNYRVAVGGVLEPSFRILREEMASWGFDKPVQWSFTLRVSSAEAVREPCFFDELSASPFGEKSAVRFEYIPAPSDLVAMDNDCAVVYITGWEPEDGVLNIEYVAVSRRDKPLRLILPDNTVLLDGREHPVELSDGFGAFATLMGYIPVPGWKSDEPPEAILMTLALVDPSEPDQPLIEDSETVFMN